MDGLSSRQQWDGPGQEPRGGTASLLCPFKFGGSWKSCPPLGGPCSSSERWSLETKVALETSSVILKSSLMLGVGSGVTPSKASLLQIRQTSSVTGLKEKKPRDLMGIFVNSSPTTTPPAFPSWKIFHNALPYFSVLR